MVGVGAAAGGDGPGLLPGHGLLVTQDPHQLGDRHGRVCVVQLDGDLGEDGEERGGVRGGKRGRMGSRMMTMKMIKTTKQ